MCMAGLGICHTSILLFQSKIGVVSSAKTNGPTIVQKDKNVVTSEFG